MAAATLLFLTVVTWMVSCSRSNSTCNVTSRLNRGTAYLSQGHYFDYDRRIPCAGTITAWNYCYYTADQFPFLNFHWIRFQIWRDVDNQTLQHVYTHHIQTTDPPDDNEGFQCRRNVVDNPIEVEAGDFIGLPSNFAQLVPVVGQGVCGSSLYIDDGDNSGFLLRRLEGLALHVDVEIESLLSSSTSRPPPLQTHPKLPCSTVDLSKMPYSTVAFSKMLHSTAAFSKMSYSTMASSNTPPTLTPSTTHHISVETAVLWSHHSSKQPSTSSKSLSLSLTPSGVTVNGAPITSLSTTTLPTASPTLSPSPSQTLLRESSSIRNGLPESGFPATPSNLLEKMVSSERDYPVNWPFIAGLVVGVILLVLIVIVFLLIIFVVSIRRTDEDSDKLSGNTESDTLFNVVAASQQQRSEQGERPIQVCERSISCKSVKAPLPLSTPITSNAANHQTPDTDIVYDAPCKISPTSNSSVCSIFSGSESHNHYRHHNHRYSRVLSSAQPYETPLVTPRNSRQTLFASNSTLNTITGSEVIVSKTTPVHTQPVPPGTMTLDRLRRVKLKKPLPVVKPAALISATKPTTHLQIPERGGREKPSSTVSDRPPKPNAPTPEPPNNTEHSQDEGYCTARYPVKLLHEENIDTNISTTQDMYCSPPDDEKDIMETLERMNILNIPRQDIQVISHIGNGEFGSVAKAYWRREVEVAVKSVPLSEHSNSHSEERIKLLQEAVMMGQFRHPNVVQLHGIATAGTSFMLVLGYLAKGDLRTHLLQMNQESLLSSTNKLLTSYSQQVALGMHYLASKGFVHRDLAARNIFVSENNTCKVGDFGMSRDLANAPYYISRGGKIPVRWTAPEAMYYHKYSSASDVWSYGCVLYEIWSLGRLPFKRFTNAQVLERLDSGYRLPPPPGTPRAIYELMIKTWHPNPRHRPEFRHVLVQLVQEEANLLHIPVGDASTSQQASQLGSPLAAGEYMYGDLQRAYLQRHEPPQEEEQYDSLIGRKYVLSFPTSSADIDYLYDDHHMQKSYRSHLMTSDTESEDT